MTGTDCVQMLGYGNAVPLVHLVKHHTSTSIFIFHPLYTYSCFVYMITSQKPFFVIDYQYMHQFPLTLTGR